MKKTILAVSAIVMASSAMAATNTTITTAKKSKLPAFIENTSVGYTMGFSRANNQDNNTSVTHYATAFTKWNDSLSTLLLLRGDINNKEENGVSQDSNEREFTFRKPRLSFFGLNTEIAGIKIRPQLRIEASTDASARNEYATVRVGVTASTNTSVANTISAFAGTYDNITKAGSDDERSTAEQSFIYLWLGDTYSFNDANSVSVLLENFMDYNQATWTTSQRKTDDLITISYANTSVKNLTVSPNIGHTLHGTTAIDNMSFGLDLTYSF